MKSMFRKIVFRLRKYKPAFLYSYLVNKMAGLKTQGYMMLDHVRFTWPHKVSVGKNTLLEQNIFFKYDGPYNEGIAITIGNNCFIGSDCEFNIKESIVIDDYALIGSGCRFIDHNHGTETGRMMKEQLCPSASIHIGKDVWLGVNVVVLMGVRIGEGAIVGAGSIVNKDIPAYEIWAGVPAKKIGDRK